MSGFTAAIRAVKAALVRRLGEDDAARVDAAGIVRDVIQALRNDDVAFNAELDQILGTLPERHCEACGFSHPYSPTIRGKPYAFGTEAEDVAHRRNLKRLQNQRQLDRKAEAEGKARVKRKAFVRKERVLTTAEIRARDMKTDRSEYFRAYRERKAGIKPPN